jgi:hypothetical protein
VDRSVDSDEDEALAQRKYNYDPQAYLWYERLFCVSLCVLYRRRDWCMVLNIVVETVRTVKNVLDHWRIESIVLFLYADLEKPMIASIAHVRDVIGML